MEGELVGLDGDAEFLPFVGLGLVGEGFGLGADEGFVFFGEGAVFFLLPEGGVHAAGEHVGEADFVIPNAGGEDVSGVDVFEVFIGDDDTELRFFAGELKAENDGAVLEIDRANEEEIGFFSIDGGGVEGAVFEVGLLGAL